MTKQTIARFAGIAAGAALVLGVVAPASAQTIAQLQAQIAALMAQLQTLQGGTGATSAISSDLTVGSSGTSVVVLQNALVAQGYLTMPAGVAPGYFGALTKAAVIKWQVANGLPGTGFFGPMSRAKFGGSAAAGGTTTGGTTSAGATGTISTPGAEGTLTVTSAPVSNSTVYEGSTNKDVLAFKAKATGSDLAIQRVKLDLSTSNNVYRDAFTKMSLVDDAGKVLASADLSSSTVIKDGTIYYLTLAGFSSVVAKDATRTYTIKADVADVIDTFASYAISLAANGVRAIDGAGIDQYSPTLVTSVTKTITTAASLVDSASLVVSANTATPLAREIVAADGSSNNEADKVTLLVFDVRADKDAVTITDLAATITGTAPASTATASTTYLYVGNGTSGTMVGSASVSGATATFSDIDYVIPAGTTKTFTLAADIRGAAATQYTFSAAITGSTQVTAENSLGASVTPSGSATGNNVLVRNVGPVFTLLSKTITASGAPQSSTANTYSTSSLTATFKVHVKAVGADVLFGTGASGTPMWNNSANYFKVYKAGVYDGTISSAATTTSITLPDSPAAVTNTVTLSKDQEADFTVSYTILGRNAASAAVAAQNSPVAVQMQGIGWISSNGAATSTFMADAPSWRTAEVSFP